MQIFEDDLYQVEHEAMGRVKTISLKPELNDQDLFRMAGFVAGVREIVNRLEEMIKTDRVERHEADLAELERQERLGKVFSNACTVNLNSDAGLRRPD